jgi:class 3 adenylate cyclase
MVKPGRDKVERRLAAILYADVAGYSRLTGLDEEDTHRKLDAGLNLLTEVIAAHGGRKLHEAGDAILAEFQSVTAAVDSAIEFQRQMSARNDGLAEDHRLEFRIGVNLGEVIHDRDDIYGDGVNLAARIQELADPGGTCVSGSVHEQVGGRVDQVFDDLGYRKVKNIAQPIHVYRIHPSEDPSDAEIPTLFGVDAKDRPLLITGRCMCGDVCFEISQSPLATAFCHCKMCQRFNSAAFSVWAVFPHETVRFTNTEPKYFKSSPFGERGFCARCGSPLTMRYYPPEPSAILGILVPTLDRPEEFAPTKHFCTESQMPWLDMHDDLPRLPSEKNPNLIRRWGAAGIPNPADWKLPS